MAEAANETSRRPLSVLLCQVLVAFTIECDNGFERQMPHRTSNYGTTAGRGAGPTGSSTQAVRAGRPRKHGARWPVSSRHWSN
jgi:hypothetical protein